MLAAHFLRGHTDTMKKAKRTADGQSGHVKDGFRRAKAMKGRGVNAAVFPARKRDAAIESKDHRHGDLDDLAGTWVKDPEFDRVIAEMDRA